MCESRRPTYHKSFAKGRNGLAWIGSHLNASSRERLSRRQEISEASHEDFLKDARAVGKALGGDVKGLQKAQVKVAEWLLARLEKVMITAMFDPQIAPTGNQKRVIPVYVGLAVACAVIDDGVVQH